MKKAIKLIITGIIAFNMLMPVFLRQAGAEIDGFDTTFNSVGYATHHNAAGGDDYDEGNDGIVLSDGRYVVTGFSTNAGWGTEMTVWRYSSDGTLDTTFSTDGFDTQIGAAGGDCDEGHAVVVQPDGKYIITGDSLSSDTTWDMAIWKYNTNGTLDTTFNSVGYTSHNNAAGGSDVDLGRDIIVQPDGKYVVTGYSSNASTDYDMVIWRYNSDGTLDTDFNTVGYVSHDNAAGGNGNDYGLSIARQTDGKYLVAGASTNLAGDTDMTVWRYNSNGTLDTTFNSVGYITHNNAAGGNSDDRGNEILVQTDGKYIIAGYSTNLSVNTDMTIWRYNSDATLDTTFNLLGYTSHNNAAGGNTDDLANSISIQSDGKYILTGSSVNGAGDNDMVIWRYNSDGTLDTDLNLVGYVIHNNAAGGNSDDNGQAVVVESNGVYFVAGDSKRVTTDPDMAIWRYESIYQIDLTGIRPTSDGLDIRVGSVNGEKQEDVLVSIDKNTVLIAQVNADMWHDLDWSAVIGDTSTIEYKSFIHNLSEADGVDGLITLYVPYGEGDDRVGICPDAVLLSEVNENCPGLIEKQESDADVAIVTIDDMTYWRVTGLIGTGGFSYRNEGLPSTGDSIYIFTGGLWFYLSE